MNTLKKILSQRKEHNGFDYDGLAILSQKKNKDQYDNIMIEMIKVVKETNFKETFDQIENKLTIMSLKYLDIGFVVKKSENGSENIFIR